MTIPQPPLLQSPLLPTSRKFPKEIEELEPTLSKMYSDVSQAVNLREIAIYENVQTSTGQKWFNTVEPEKKRSAFRRVYTLASIANGTNTIALGFTLPTTAPLPTFVHIYGVGNYQGTRSVPIPHINVAAPADSIEIRINWATSNIEIVTTTANWVNYSAVVVLEYILN